MRTIVDIELGFSTTNITLLSNETAVKLDYQTMQLPARNEKVTQLYACMHVHVCMCELHVILFVSTHSELKTKPAH